MITQHSPRTNDRNITVLALGGLAHLLRTIRQGHDATALTNFRLWQIKADIVAKVKTIDDVAGNFNMLQLIVSHRDIYHSIVGIATTRRIVQHNVSRHENGVGE